LAFTGKNYFCILGLSLGLGLGSVALALHVSGLGLRTSGLVNITAVILCTINSSSLNYPVSRRPRTLMLVLPLKFSNPVISLPSYALSTGSKLLKESNTNSSHLSLKFSQLPNHHTFTTSSLFNVLDVLALHLLLFLLGHQHHPL